MPGGKPTYPNVSTFMSALQVVAWTDWAEGRHADRCTHLYMPARFHTASPMYAVSHTPVYTHTDTCRPFMPAWYCMGFPFDVEFVFGCRGSVAAEESDVV